jgi:MFS family permease
MSATRLHYAWVVLAVSTLVVFGSLGLGRFGYSIVLPAMQEGLSLSNAETGALASANLAGYVVLSALGGALAARYGARRVASAGLLVAGGGMLLTGLASGFSDAALWRFLTGIGSGAGNVSVMGMLAAWFAARRRGFAAGIAVAGSSLAFIGLGPLVPRVIVAYGESGWRVSWGILGGTTLVLAAVSVVLLRDRPKDVGLEPLGAAAGPRPTPQPRRGGEPAPCDGASGTDAPGDGPSGRDAPGDGASWKDVYLSGAVWHLGLVYTAFGFSYIIYLTYFVKRLVTEGGYSREQAGDLFMTLGWCSLLCGLIWGSVSDRIGRRGALAIVYLIHTVAFGLFAVWSAPLGFTISAVLFGLSAWSVPAIMAAACGDRLGPRLAPAALGFVTLFFGLGQAVGPSVAGLMADTTGSFAPAYILAASVSFLGAVGSVTLAPSHGAAGTVPPACR